ncbi:hypothetical protein F5Y06DRAFT_295685 [Hypoxylon sp. FL0890]|nr:hypothetical protein F5Y06DRAFT_295685 [Hypoxylon sp. FL0890]
MDESDWTKITTSRPPSTDDTIFEESLEEYIRAAYPAIDTDTHIQNETTTSPPASSSTIPQEPPKINHPKPVLKKCRTNRILLYNGCFNPPHQGHLAHLTHAYRHSGSDLNIVGAIVLVAGDHYLRWKMGRAPETLRLTAKQRIELWNRELRTRGPDRDGQGGGSADWCWVLPEEGWMATEQSLERLFRMDGFEVEFVRLAGGDKVRLRDVQHGVWGCRMLITTDVSRPVEFCDGEGRMWDLASHTKWRRVQLSGEGDVLVDENAGAKGGELALDESRSYGDSMAVNLPTSTRQTQVQGIRNPLHAEMCPLDFIPDSDLRAISPAVAMQATTSAPERKREIWVCESTFGGPGLHTIRFVSSIPQERFDPTLSSTKLRNIIAEAVAPDGLSQNERLEDKLWGVALSPELLARFIREKIEKDAREMEEWVKKMEKEKEKGMGKEAETFAEGGEEMGRDLKKQRRHDGP